MPQRDDKVGIHFGRISKECWERLGDRPGAVIEAAVEVLVKEIEGGREIFFPASLRSGVTKKLWLRPETVAALNAISDRTGVRKTPLILAALGLYYELSPRQDAASGRGPRKAP
jgi:hypothetical protein